MLTSQFMMVSLKQIFELVEKAKKEDYELFEDNIRQYVGQKGNNKKIIATINDENEVNNFYITTTELR